MPTTPSNRTTIALYDGEVEVEFEAEPHHRYWVDKKRVVGVTTIIDVLNKPQLVPWAVGLALDYVQEHKDLLTLDADTLWANAQAESERQKRESADLGKLIHEWADAYIKGQAPQMPTDVNVLRGVVSFLEWVDKHGVEFLQAERIVYSKEDGYIGTMDFLMLIDGKLCVGDLKTGNGLYPTVAMQTAAYAKAYTEETGDVVAGRWAVRVAKETEGEYQQRMWKKNESRVRRGLEPLVIKPYEVFEAVELGDQKEDYASFRACLDLYRWNQKASKLFR